MLRALAADWVPIGSKVGNFGISYEGIYCGNGYTISGLRITTPAGWATGLFGSVSGSGSGSSADGHPPAGGEITGTDHSNIGALAGYVSGGTVTLARRRGR